MKKTIIVLVSVLAGVFILLTIAGSGGEYYAEKAYYDVTKLSRALSANPDVVPPKLTNDIEAGFQAITRKYPKTMVARMAHMSLAEFYVFLKRYDKALAKLDEILKIYAESRETSSTAAFLKGRVYELQKDWPKALKQYKNVRDKYADTEVGLQIPLYIGKHYADRNKDAEAKEAYSDAVAFYSKLQSDNKGLMLGYFASSLKIQAYVRMQDFASAGRALEETLISYMSDIAMMQLLPVAEFIYVDRMKEPQKAIALFEKCAAKLKNGKMKTSIEKRIETIKKGKSTLNNKK